MKNTIKNRAYQWFRLDLACELYWDWENISGYEYSYKYIEDIEHMDGKFRPVMLLSEKVILIDWMNIRQYIKDGTQEQYDFIESILNEWELPDNITDVLILKSL